MTTPVWLAAHRLQDSSARGLASFVAELIRSGELTSGEALPPVRAIADILRVSPATVSSAWAVLKRRGLLRGTGRSGIRVTSMTGGSSGHDYYSTVPGGNDLRLLYPDVRLLPPLANALAAAAKLPNLNEYYGNAILPSLRDVVHPTWPYPAEEYMATNGGSDALWTVLHANTVPGDRIVMESPTQPQLLPLIDELGLTLVPVSYGASGLDLAEFKKAMATRPAAVFYQSRAQIPTGYSTSKTRVDEIVTLLQGLSHRPLVIEYDDLADLARTSHHSIGSKLPGQVVTIRSYEKSYGPDLRLAVIGSSDDIMRVVHPHVRNTRLWTSRILQGALAWLLRDEETQMRIGEASIRYGSRLDDFVAALRNRDVTVNNRDGFCAWVPVIDQSATTIDLLADGVLVLPGTRSFTARSEEYVRVATSRLEPDQVEGLADLVAASSRRSP